MIEKFKANKKIIYIVLSIVAIAMFIPSLFGLFMNQLNDASIILLIYYLCLIGAAGSILFIVYTKNELNLKLQIIPVSLTFGGMILTNIYNMINNNSFLNVYYVALYALAIIFYVMYALNIKQMKYILYVIFVILFAFQIVSVLGGSAFGLGILILIVIYIINIYLDCEEGEEN